MSAASDPKTHVPYTIEKHGFRTIYYSMVGQYGTHCDPPAHFDPNGITMDKIPLDQMILPLVVFDDTKYFAKDENHALSVDDIKAWEKEHGEVPKGAFAALRTDMYKDWDTNQERFKRFPFPAWSLETIKYLFEHRGVTAIGHEGLDTDITETMELRDLDPEERPLPDRGHGQSRSSAGDRCGHRRDLAQGRERLWLPGAGVRDTAVGANPEHGQ